jgi:hypothetical protein
MAKDTPTPPPTMANDGFQPLSKGHQPGNFGHQPIAARPTSSEQAGHQPTTSQGGAGPGTPPTQSGSGKK